MWYGRQFKWLVRADITLAWHWDCEPWAVPVAGSITRGLQPPLPWSKSPQTFTLSVAASVYKSTSRKFLRKGDEKQRMRSRGRARWPPGSIVLVTLLRIRETAAFFGGGASTVSWSSSLGYWDSTHFTPEEGRRFSSLVRLRKKYVEQYVEHSSSLFCSPCFSSDSLLLSETTVTARGTQGRAACGVLDGAPFSFEVELVFTVCATRRCCLTFFLDSLRSFQVLIQGLYLVTYLHVNGDKDRWWTAGTW